MPNKKMKIGIIVYSYSGNTLSVAETLAEELKKDKHQVTIEKIEVIDDNPEIDKPIEFQNIPKISDYELIIFASPVRTFSLAPPMKKYLTELPKEEKRAYCFVTQHLKSGWLGGRQAIGQIKNISQAKGIKIEKTGIINWSNKKREEQIKNIIDNFSQ